MAGSILKKPWKILTFSLLLLWGCGGSTSGGGASGSGSTGTSGGVQSAASDMSVGDVLYVSFGGASSSVSFSGASGTYELILQNQATSSGTGTFVSSSLNAQGKSIGLSDPLADWSDELAEGAGDSVQVQFEEMLRSDEAMRIGEAWEGVAKSASLSQSKNLSVGKAGDTPSVALSVGDQKSFKVLSSLTDTSQYVTVTGQVRCVNDKVAIYVDTEVLDTNPSDLPQADIDSLCVSYKRSLGILNDLIGAPSDVNSDGVVVQLITPQVNRLTSSGIVTGFFWGGDFTSSGNLMEIIYSLTPDSAGLYGTKVSNAFAMSNFLPAVFPHEVQHLINYYQHTIARTGGSEENWLNEAMSHLMEDLAGQGRENYSRYDLYLAAPQSYSLVTTSSPSLAQRGAGYLFLRYLYEQSGSSATFLSNLVKTTRTGIANIEASFPAAASDFNDMGEFLKNWSIAVAYTDRGLTNGSRFKYNTRTIDSTTGNYMGVCMICSASDGRGTVLNGPSYNTYSSTSLTVKTSAARFFRFSSMPASVGLNTSGTITPSASVIRTK